MSFSGVVKDSAGKPVSGSVSLTFSMYELQDGGRPLWVETQTVQTDEQGQYTVILGANSPDGLPLDLFTGGSARWLGIAPAIPGVGELPRVLLVGVPYALKAADAETLGGKPASAYVLNPQSNATIGAVTGPTAASNENVPAPSKNPRSESTARTETATGTLNYVAKFTDSNNDLGDSEIYDTGTKVGIGTSTPAATLDVNGNFNLPATTSTSVGAINLGGAPFIHACCPKSAGNTFLGTNAGSFSADASASNNANGFNTGVGGGALLNLTTGYENTALGVDALWANHAGAYNTATGALSLWLNATGSNNTADGAEALTDNTTGAYNTGIGYGALFSNTTGSNNTAVGANAGAQTGLNYATAIGAGATVTESNALVLGGTGVSAVNVGIGTTSPTAKLNIVDSTNPAVYLQTNSGQAVRFDISNGTSRILPSGSGAKLQIASGNVGDTGLVYDATALNVGIGTTSPTAKLDVVGGVKIEGTGNGITFPNGSVQTTAAGGGVTGVTAGTGLTGGGTEGNVTLNVDTTKIPQLAAANTFTANQTVKGNVSISGSGNGIVFSDGTKQTTASGAGAATTDVAQVYGNGSPVDLSCPNGYVAICATCNAGSGPAGVVINDQNTPIPSGFTWPGYLTPSATNSTGVHCRALLGGQYATAILRCVR
jgi:hypothetical protein